MKKYLLSLSIGAPAGLRRASHALARALMAAALGVAAAAHATTAAEMDAYPIRIDPPVRPAAAPAPASVAAIKGPSNMIVIPPTVQAPPAPIAAASAASAASAPVSAAPAPAEAASAPPTAAAPAAPVSVSTAAGDSPEHIGDAMADQVRQLAMSSTGGGAEVAVPGGPRIEIEVGKLDPRLKLAPCTRVEPHLPPGVKLWGRSRIGLRCVQGPTKWSVYIPVTVKVFAKSLVAVTSLSAGSPLAAADFAEAEVDIAAEQGAVISDPALVVGRTLYGPMAPGQPLRQTLLKPRKFFDSGDTVTITANGNGFSASGEGQALTNGMEGMPARIRMENGKILTGVPISDHRVDVKL